MALLGEDEFDDGLVPKLSPLPRLLVVEPVDLVEDGGEADAAVQQDQMISMALGNLEQKREVFTRILIVRFCNEDRILHFEFVENEVQDLGDVEIGRHPVALFRDLACFRISRLERRQRVVEREEFAAKIFTNVGQGRPVDDHILQTVRQGLHHADYLGFFVALRVGGPVRLRVLNIADGPEALSRFNPIVFVLIFFIIPQNRNFMILVVLLEIDVVIVIREQLFLQLLFNVSLHLSPRGPHYP